MDTQETTSIRRLTKSDILNGNKDVKYVYFEDLGGELPLRSLTDGQYAQVEAVRTRGSRLKGMPTLDKDGNPDMEKSNMGVEIDMEKMTEAEHEADCLAVFYGIADGASWTVTDVKQMTPPGIVAKIAREIYIVSGVKSKKAKLSDRIAEGKLQEARAEEVKNFRPE